MSRYGVSGPAEGSGRIWQLGAVLAVSTLVTGMADARPSGGARVDPQRIAAFLEAFLPPRMERLHVPGSVFVMVHRDRMTLAKAFGKARLEEDRPIDTQTTVFRVASISKIFTATAVMKLVEEGRLDLEADVNRYLEDFEVPEGGRGPVTVRSLLTHTAGFDERYIGLHKRTEAEVTPLGEFLARELPDRCMDTDTLYSYSNHGSALAGYLVERVTGRSFSSYVDEAIIGPLGLTHSSFDLTPRLREGMAWAYDHEGGAYKQVPLTHANVGPAGGLNASPADMARFMRMHLNGGTVDGVRILSPATVATMHRTHFTHDPRLPGKCLGFSEAWDWDTRGLRHTGFAPGYISLFYIVPEADLGFFLCSTSVSAYSMHDEFRREFMSLVFGSRTAGESGIGEGNGGTPITDPSPYVGAYRFVRHPRATYDRLPVLLSSCAPEIIVTVDPDRRLVLQGLAGEPVTLEPMGDHIFRTPAGQRVAFRVEEGGFARYLFAEHSTGPGAFERLGWHQTRSTLRGWLLLLTLALSLLLLGRRVPCPVMVPRERLVGLQLRDLSAGLALGGLVLLYVPVLTLYPLVGGFPQHTFGPSPWIYPMQILSLLLVVGYLALVHGVRILVTSPRVPDRERGLALGSLIVFTGLMAFLHHCALIGFTS